jgi:hypothetical protein
MAGQMAVKVSVSVAVAKMPPRTVAEKVTGAVAVAEPVSVAEPVAVAARLRPD